MADNGKLPDHDEAIKIECNKAPEREQTEQEVLILFQSLSNRLGGLITITDTIPGEGEG